MKTKKSKLSREEQLYKETYRAGSLWSDHDTMTAFQKSHRFETSRIVEIHLRAAGNVRRGDENLEFVDVRIYAKEFTQTESET